MDTLQVVTTLTSPAFGLLGVWLGGHLQAKKDREREAERWQRDDRHRWLDEQYATYRELMATMSAAVNAVMTAFAIHPSYIARRRAAEEAGQFPTMVADAKSALVDAQAALLSCALIAHDNVYDAAQELRHALVLAVLSAERSDTPSLIEWTGRAHDLHGQLRTLVRLELGVR